jgi:hypothetical protein
MDLKQKIHNLLENEDLYRQFSAHAREVITTEASYENMIKGFMDAIHYVQTKSVN